MSKITLVSLLLSAFILSSCGGEIDDIANTDISTEISEETESTENTEQVQNEQSETTNSSDIQQPETNETTDSTEVIEEPVVREKATDEEIRLFFEESAFVGDSVMHGMELYCRRVDCMQSPATFLTVTSFSARHAISELTEKSYHPSYNGEKMLVEDALKLDEAKRVFISIGLNDVLSSPNTCFDQYCEFISRIKNVNPDIDVYIFSATSPVTKPSSSNMSAETAQEYKTKILALNANMKAFCDAGNATFLDVASPLLNENGFLSDKYTSDGYVHLTNKSYELWSVMLTEYADAIICGRPLPSAVAVVNNYLGVVTPSDNQEITDTAPQQGDTVQPEIATEITTEPPEVSTEIPVTNVIPQTEIEQEQTAEADPAPSVQNEAVTEENIQ